MRHVVSRLIASVFVTAMFAVNGQSAAAAGGTVHVEQKSGGAAYGEWTLTMPNGSDYTSTLKSKVLTGLPAGTYRLNVRPLGNSSVAMSLYRDGILREDTQATSLAFDLKETESVRIAVNYARKGTVEVHSNPEGVTFIMKNGDGKAFTGTTPAVFADMTPSWYRVTYDLAQDCEAQKQQERALLEGMTLYFTVNLDCGTRKIATTGKTSKQLATGAKPPVIATSESTVSPAERIVQTSSVGEVLPGGRVRVTVSVRNLTQTTLQNVRVTDRFNPAAIEILEPLQNGGTVAGNELIWNIPQITAGATWTTTFDTRIKDGLKAGDRVLLMANVTSDTSDNRVRPEAPSAVLGIGIAYLPQTGGRFDALFVLAALLAAGVMTRVTLKAT